MTQTLAIFYDAYRSLNAKKMFWIVLIVSVLVAGSFGCVGITERGLKILVWQFDTEPLTSEAIAPAVLYKLIFVTFGIGFWLGWLATILALISTAGVFPDLITSGSIDLLVSKPIGRVRLFFTQYSAGLLFVALQVTLFTLASFLVIGLRGGAWEPGLFVAVPVVVCFFSYLFSVCVLLGLVTRSTVAALLLTLLFWALIYGVGAAENVLLAIRLQEKHGTLPPPSVRVGLRGNSRPPAASAQDRPGAMAVAGNPERSTDPPAEDDTRTRRRGGKVPRAIGKALLRAVAEPSPPDHQQQTRQTPAGPGAAHPGGKQRALRPANPPGADEHKESSAKLKLAHHILYGVKTVLPKTTETVGLLERSLYSMADLPEGVFGQPPGQAKAEREVAETLRSRSVWWVVGTSLGFEFFVLCGAAWIFCRRDF